MLNLNIEIDMWLKLQAFQLCTKLHSVKLGTDVNSHRFMTRLGWTAEMSKSYLHVSLFWSRELLSSFTAFFSRYPLHKCDGDEDDDVGDEE